MLHKIVESGGESYLPFALGRLRALKQLGLAYVVQRFSVNGVNIKISVQGPQDYVTVSGGPGAYEFFCSDVGVNTSNPPGIPANASLFTDYYEPAVTGAGVKLMGAAALPAFSNTLLPTSEQVWRVLPFPIGPSSSGAPPQTKFFSGNSLVYGAGNTWQDQKGGEYSWWHNNTDQVLITSTLGFGHGKLSQVFPSPWATTAFSGGIGPTGAYTFTEYTTGTTQHYPGSVEMSGPGIFDVPPSMFTSVSSVSAGSKRGGASSMANWRRAAVQKVYFNGVAYYYCLSSDHHGQFSCYRMRSYVGDPLFTGYPGVDNIPSAYVRVASPTYPGWCTVPADTDRAVEHWAFTFNKDGTKAVTTPFEKVATYMWLGAENVRRTISPPTLDYLPRTSLPAEVGDGIGGRFPTMGCLWPIEATITDTPFYTVTREQIYRPVNKVAPAPITAINIQGDLYQVSQARLDLFFPGASPEGFIPPETAANYEPAFTSKPGLLEVGFTITIGTGPDDFTFAVSVLQEEAYSVNKRFYVDAGYYAPDARTKSMDGMPAEDVLLVAEIEAYCLAPNAVATAAHNVYGHAETSNDTHTTATATYLNSYNYTKADEPNCEGAWIANYTGDIAIQYVVRDRATATEYKRFALADNIFFMSNWIGRSHAPAAAHFGSILFADLRKLNFITRSHSIVGAAPTSWWNTNWNTIPPRYELRVNGTTLRTINYSAGGHNYASDNDPMTTKAVVPSGYTKLPSAGGFAGGGAPDSFLLQLQLWAIDSLIMTDVEVSISTHPRGSWSCCYRTDRTAGTRQAAYSTEPDEVFDIIQPTGSSATTHKDAFNRAFGQSRSYSYYKTPGEMGSFCTYGIWYGLSPLKG